MKRVFVTFQKKGLHRYPAATELPGVEFLANVHRHLFKFRVTIEVFHDDRDIEFLLFQDFCEKLFEGDLNVDFKSCEMISNELAEKIQAKYPGRWLEIEVSEDGENGSIIDYPVEN